MVRVARGRGAGRLPPPPLMARNNGMPPPMRPLPPRMRHLPPHGMRSPPPFIPPLPPMPPIPPTHMRGLPPRLPPGPPIPPPHRRNMPPRPMPFPPRPPMMFPSRGPMMPPGPMMGDPRGRRRIPPPLMGGRMQGPAQVQIGKMKKGNLRKNFKNKNQKPVVVGPWQRKAKNPWITEEVLKLIEERRKYVNATNVEGRKRFLALKNEISRKAKKAKEVWLEQQKSKENNGKGEESKEGCNEVDNSVKEQENNGLDANNVDNLKQNNEEEMNVEGTNDVVGINVESKNISEAEKVEIAV